MLDPFIKLTYKERIGAIGVFILFMGITIYKSFDQEDLRIQLQKGSDPIPLQIIKNPIDTLKSLKGRRRIAVRDTIQLTISSRFNPNLFEVKDWISIGFDEQLSKRLYKFIKLKQGISHPNDLREVYGFNESWLAQLRDSLNFTVPRVNINTSDTLLLKSISGIGSILSARIVKYRSLLGGFSSVKQLSEVYGVSDELFIRVKDKVVVDSSFVKIDVRRSGSKKLSNHPYISKDQALQLIVLKSTKDNMTESDFLGIFSSDEWEKVKPYLQWSH